MVLIWVLVLTFIGVLVLIFIGVLVLTFVRVLVFIFIRLLVSNPCERGVETLAHGFQALERDVELHIRLEDFPVNSSSNQRGVEIQCHSFEALESEGELDLRVEDLLCLVLLRLIVIKFKSDGDGSERSNDEVSHDSFKVLAFCLLIILSRAAAEVYHPNFLTLQY